MRAARLLGIASLLGLGLATGAACRKEPEITSDPKTTSKPPPKVEPEKKPRTPKRHRSEHEGCSRADTTTVTYAPMPPPPLGPACTTRADCKGMTNPRCAAGHCVSDACYEDEDCKDGGVCTCEQSGARGWYCKPGNCAVDADCSSGGASGFCSPTWDMGCGAFFGVVGWYCHTKQDECVDDADCKDDEGKGPGFCAYDKEQGKWRCGYGHCVG